MTIDQAIYILNNTAWLGTNEDREKMEQAINTAVDGLIALKHIMDSGDCNTCALLHSQCRYAPRLGEQVRYNCPFYYSRGKEGGEE